MHQLIAEEAARHMLEDRVGRAHGAWPARVRRRRIRRALGYGLVRVGARWTDAAGLARAVTASCSSLVLIDGRSSRR
jgi:hypothetical protein